MAGQVAEKSALVSSLEASKRRLSEELLEQRVAFDRQLKDFREAKEANSELVAELDNERVSAKAMAGQVAEKSALVSSLEVIQKQLTEELREQRVSFDSQLSEEKGRMQDKIR